MHAPVTCIGEIRRLLARSCPSLALSPVFPAKAFCKRPTRKWPIGADTKIPYMAILKALESIRARARALVNGEASLGTWTGARPATFDPMTSCRKEKVPAYVHASDTLSVSCAGLEGRLTRRQCLGTQWVCRQLREIMCQQRVHRRFAGDRHAHDGCGEGWATTGQALGRT